MIYFGATVLDALRRAAAQVDKILKGAPPGDLPFELPTTYDPVVNLRTARALGLNDPAVDPPAGHPGHRVGALVRPRAIRWDASDRRAREALGARVGRATQQAVGEPARREAAGGGAHHRE